MKSGRTRGFGSSGFSRTAPVREMVSRDDTFVSLSPNVTRQAAAADGRSFALQGTPSLRITAGEHHIAVAFVKKQDGPLEDVIRPHDWSYAGGGSGVAGTPSTWRECGIPHGQIGR